MKKIINNKYLTYEIFKENYREYNEIKKAKRKDDNDYYDDNIEIKQCHNKNRSSHLNGT